MRSGRVPVLSDFQLRWLAVFVLCMPSMVWAHTGGEGSGGSFLHGVTHPFSGGDHLLAMLAVGLWAAQNGGRWLWSLPAVFVMLMLAGATAALAGWGLPYAEQAVVASLFLFGLMVAGACPAGAVFGVLLVGAFADFPRLCAWRRNTGDERCLQLCPGLPAVYGLPARRGDRLRGPTQTLADPSAGGRDRPLRRVLRLELKCTSYPWRKASCRSSKSLRAPRAFVG